MDMKADENQGEYENYEGDTFYLELERQIVQLIDNSDEVKPRKLASSSVGKNSNVITGKARIMGRRNYYDWTVCGSSINGPVVFSYYPTADFTGTGVFIPQSVKFEFQDCEKKN